MKNIKYILLLMFCVIGCICLSGCGTSGTMVYNNGEKEIGSLTRLEKEETWAYLELVEDEAVQILCEQNKSSKEEATKLLQENEYHIYTYFDADIFEEMGVTYQTYKSEEPSFGCAATDLQGHLIAVYSGGNGDVNFATKAQVPYSSFKPLSVYLPALEEGTAYWSKTYEDSPFKEITLANGDKEEWPVNVTGTYSGKDVVLKDAVALSLNTVAVKCLNQYGVKKSMDFLKSHFDIPLAFEREKMAKYGEEEILGNIGLGYLDKGVSPVEMAGYYQIFANGGQYALPKAIYKITDEGGTVIYQHAEDAKKQSITKEAASVMNALLQNVVSSNGTGADAEIPGIQVGGKTGTGEKGNWFVGFTPEYTCAVWHGTALGANYAASMFAETVSTWKHDKEITYPACGTVKQAIYCKDSGLLMTGKCKDFELGYYMSVKCPSDCERH